MTSSRSLYKHVYVYALHTVTHCYSSHDVVLTLPPIALARCGVDDNCDPNAVCVNTDTGFVCECLAGYEGNGVDCSKLYSSTNDNYIGMIKGQTCALIFMPKLFDFAITICCCSVKYACSHSMQPCE